jgi:hypothetical protein
VLKSSLNSGSLPTASFLHSLPYRTDFQLSRSHAGGHLTPNSYSSLHRLTERALTLSLAYNISALTTYRTPFLCCMCIRCRGNLSAEPFPSSDRLVLLTKHLLPSNWRRSVVCFFGLCLETNAVSKPFASNGSFYGSTVLAWSKYATISTQLIIKHF